MAMERMLAGLSRASRNCPAAAMKPARWWPRDLPGCGHLAGLGQWVVAASSGVLVSSGWRPALVEPRARRSAGTPRRRRGVGRTGCSPGSGVHRGTALRTRGIRRPPRTARCRAGWPAGCWGGSSAAAEGDHTGAGEGLGQPHAVSAGLADVGMMKQAIHCGGGEGFRHQLVERGRVQI